MAEEYTHIYTGSQIDEAVGKALPMADYIEDFHISVTVGEWSYLKFHSGICALWGQFNINPEGSTASGTEFFSDTIYLTMPFPVGYAVISGTVENRFAMINPGSNSEATPPYVSFRLSRGTDIQSTTVMARVMVFGRWAA